MTAPGFNCGANSISTLLPVPPKPQTPRADHQRRRGRSENRLMGYCGVVAVPTVIRVASIPANHPYVHHLSACDGPDGVTRLTDPLPEVEDPIPGQWWPPVMLEPDWVAGHHRDFDVMHLHFGFDAAQPATLRHWCEELARNGRPLVMTVHDLVNPHFADQGRHAALLDVLIPGATRLITLTPGAARAIEDRWGRRPDVVPHPHIVPLDRIPLPKAHDPTRLSAEFVIGISAKSLRANIDPLPVLLAMDGALSDLPRTTVRVDLHPDIWTRHDRSAVALREWLDSKRNDPSWQVSTHPRFDDEELWEHLRSLDLCVLPYAFGTHSGWLEACVDVGTGVLVPDIGYYSEQHGHPVFARTSDGVVDRAQFADVLGRLRAEPALATPARPDRREQRRRITLAHERIYREALIEVGPGTA